MSVSLSFFPCYGLYCSHFFFFFNDTATTEIYTLSLHDALPISRSLSCSRSYSSLIRESRKTYEVFLRSEEHTSELQSQSNLVCRLLLEKKKKKRPPMPLSDFLRCVVASL